MSSLFRPMTASRLLPSAVSLLLPAFGSLTAQSWVQLAPASSPGARVNSVMAYDVMRSKTILYGGHNAAGIGLGDTWQWDGVNWNQLTPPTSPPPRWGHSMVYDSARLRMVMFGGYVPGAGTVDDTWEWDGQTWTQRSPTVAPPARGHHGMAFDSARGKTVLFGGWLFPSTYFGDTWEWDGTNWQAISTSAAPSGRRGPAMAFDASRATTVLFGGGDASATLADTWTWNGNTWTQMTTTVAPPARWSHAMTFDPGRGRAIMFGGNDHNFANTLSDTWEWDGVAWTPSTSATHPSPRGGHAMAYDSARTMPVSFGGGDGSTYQGETWALTQTTSNGPLSWQHPSTNFPGIRVLYPLSTDPVRGRVLLFGGIENSNTWEWNGAQWILMNSPTSPVWRHGAALAYDSIRVEHVMFGGGQYSNLMNETWTWAGSSWTQRQPSTAPSARLQHVLAFDSLRGVTVLYGGSDGVSLLSDTWSWNGVNWSPLSPQHNPGPWSNRSYAYDPSRGELLLYGAGLSHTDTWVWNGADWLQRVASTSPGPRDNAGMAYHPPSSRIFMYGGEWPYGTFLGGTWSWNGSDWRLESPAGAPCNAPPYAAAFDTVTEKILVFIGHPYSACGTWLLDVPSGPRSCLTPYGIGCPGSNGVPTLTAATNSLPVIGQTFTLRLSNLPVTGFFTWALPFFGFSTTSSGGVALPRDLGLLGMPGCTQYVDPVQTAFLITPTSTVDWLLAIPNAPYLAGLPLHFQAAIVDLPANPIGLTATNAGTAILGW